MTNDAAMAEILRSAPQLDCENATLERVFAQRWRSFVGNLVPSPYGTLVTEFRQPGPGRAFGTVNAAAGHHILEGRWLGRTDVIEDYIRYWYTAPEAEPHRYTEWIAWAAGEYARTHRGWDRLAGLLPGMVANYRAWEGDSRHGSGLYWAHDLADAMEFSISGDGFRPTINSYQYGNARAIAEFARRAGLADIAEEFGAIATGLAELVETRLYDDEWGLFVTIPLSPGDEASYLETAGAERRMPPAYRRAPVPAPADRDPGRIARELAGYLPWYFDLPGSGIDPGRAVAQLIDPAGFAAAAGPTTAERRHPRYRFPVATTDPRFLCRWNGPVWPFATSQTLSALAVIARRHPDLPAADVFLDLLLQYAAAHLDDDGEYRLDEDLDPDTGSWLTRTWRLRNDPARADVGRDYQHSTFADLVISGLLGLRCDDEGVVLDPLPSISRLGRLRLTDVPIAGTSATIEWNPATGLRLGVGVVEVARSNVGVLSVRV